MSSDFLWCKNGDSFKRGGASHYLSSLNLHWAKWPIRSKFSPVSVACSDWGAPVFLLPRGVLVLRGCWGITGLPPTLNTTVPIHTLEQEEVLWESAVLLKNTTQWSRQGLEPGHRSAHSLRTSNLRNRCHVEARLITEIVNYACSYTYPMNKVHIWKVDHSTGHTPGHSHQLKARKLPLTFLQRRNSTFR